ncbi:hypothetical protein WJX77_008370 [Trebouxia sp. C0004]
MHSAPGEEGRFELALSTSLLNELKYGSQLGKLAEALLLSAFSDSSIKPSLQQEIAAALPSVRYISLAAFLNGGVVIRSSNLAVQGDVSVRAQAMGHSAARIAAKQHSIFHGQKKPGEPIKFQELQEAWDQQQCTSTVSVPIPASRHFEDAFIPFQDSGKPLPDRGTCPVLYVANGTVGVVHFGLSTTDVKLTGRQGKQFVGLAQSLGPHLGYLLAPALEGLQAQIKSVAAANQQLQQSRRRSVSCSLLPVETLTVHDSADSISSARQGPAAAPLPNRQGHPRTGQHPPQQRAGSRIPPPPQPQQSATRMLSPFQTWSAPVAPQAAAQEAPIHEQLEGSPRRPASDRLDLSPAKTALDMSMLDVARLNAAASGSGRPPLRPEAAVRRSSGDQGSGRQSATAAEVNAAAVAVMRSSKELELEYQPSIEASPRGSQEFGRGKGKTHRRPPVPMLRASSPLSAYGSESSGNLPRQLSIPGASFAGYAAMNEPQQAQEAASPASPFAQPASSQTPSQTPFASGLSVSSSPPSSAWYASPSMQTSGSTISISSLLPPLSAFSQAPGSNRRQSCMSPHAAASLAASLPPEMSTSAMAVLSSPMTAMQPSFHAQSMAALTMPTILPMSGSGNPGRSPNQQSRSMLPPAPFAEPQARADLHSSSYRSPPQLQSRSLLLHLLPPGSAQSLNQLMFRAASGPSADFNPQDSMRIARSCSLNNDITTSVSVSSPKRSLLDMSRAVSEQLHLTSTSKALQPFLADLQQKWTAGHQGSGLLRYTPETEESDAAVSPNQ